MTVIELFALAFVTPFLAAGAILFGIWIADLESARKKRKENHL